MDKLTILSTSDTHGYLYPTDFRAINQDLPFGLSKAVTAIKKEQQKQDSSIVLNDNGDFLQGSPMSYYLSKKENSKQVADIMNSVGYDVGVLGNHEFNYGVDYLLDTVSQLNYPIVCANILNENNDPLTGQAYVILEKNGLKIAILGLTTPYIPNWEQPETIKGLTFLSALEIAKHYVPKLREQADVVIVSYHGGFEKDLTTGEPTENLTGENEGYDIVTQVEGIDAFVTGHQHRVIAEKIKGTPVTQPGDKAKHVGKITLTLSDDNTVTGSTAELLTMADYDADANIVTTFKPVLDTVENWLDQPLGHIDGDMTITDPMTVRTDGHPYIEFIQDVQMDATGADISGTALFDNDSKGFKSDVTMRDIVTNYIYPNTLAVLTVSGQDLKDALEQSAEYFALNENGEIVVSDKFLYPKTEHYNYDMYSGVGYKVKVSNPVGERVTELTYKNQPVQMDDSLDIVINQYRAVGGGNYAMFDASKIIKEVTVDMTELISNFLQTHPTYKAKTSVDFKVEK
ncbi:bifunctional metallophosphatase/5'-nucleotidase [Vagococcus sp. JNUCC 83]